MFSFEHVDPLEKVLFYKYWQFCTQKREISERFYKENLNSRNIKTTQRSLENVYYTYYEFSGNYKINFLVINFVIYFEDWDSRLVE